MNIPSNFSSTIVYDPSTNTYIIQKKIGNIDFGAPQVMNFFEYQQYVQNNLENDYWSLRSKQRLAIIVRY